LLILIGLIVSGRSPSNSVFWGIIAVIGISALRKNTRMGPKRIIHAIRTGVIAGLPVAIACAGAGIITGVIGLTGLGLRFSSILIEFSGGYLFLMLIMAMITAIILGLGMPMSATYAILAVLTAPAIVRLGIEPLAAHYFLFFFGAMSTITPPVGLSAIAAAGIAKADPMRTSFEAVRMGLVGFILPFMAVYNTGLLLMDTPLNSLITIAFCAMAVVGLTFATQGITYRKLNIVERIVFLVPVAVIFFPTPLVVNLGAVAVGVLVLLWTRRGSQLKAVS
jgi:TRAP transporter 4TM/12TM fusion protein